MGRLNPLTREMSQYDKFCQPSKLNSASVVGGVPLKLQFKTFAQDPVKHGPVLVDSLKLQFVLAQIRPVQSNDTHN